MLVKNGTLVTPEGLVRADLGIKDGRISSIGASLGGAVEEIDAEHLHVLPGLVDVHVHFREPGMEYKEDFGSGSRAAAAGGVTTVLDMPNTNPPTSTGARLREKRSLAEGKSCVDFGLYGVVLQDNEQELEAMVSEGAIGFKLFMGETTGNNPCPDDAAIFGAFRRSAGLDRVVGVHAENNPVLQRLRRELEGSGRTDPLAHPESRPPFVEAEAVGRALALAEGAGNRLHVHHVSTREGVELVSRARRRGVSATCEALVAHLLLDEDAYARHGNLVKLNPPIRGKEQVAGLWRALARGEIDCVATDHAPHSAEEQGRGNVWEGVGGFIGVETLLALMLDLAARGLLSMEDLVRLCSANPARIYGLYPRKGSLQVGADADLVLVDAAARYRIEANTLHSKHPVSPYEGWNLTGRPVATYLRGSCIAREGEVFSKPGGRMVGSHPEARVS